MQCQKYIFILVYEVMPFLKNGHGKSWESHVILFSDLCGTLNNFPISVNASAEMYF